jgi:hypothetical protein
VPAALFVAGCGREDIRVYTVPKEPASAQQPPEPSDAPAAPPLRWTLPDGWKEAPPSEFRVASFRARGKDAREDADVSIVPLPGGAGGDLANVNRWRGQVDLAPVTEKELAALAEKVEVGGQPAALYDLAGESMRILAVIQRRDGMAWFFKMTGNPDWVARQKPIFVQFLKSVQFGAPTTPASPGRPRWQAPADWKEVAAGEFLVAKFEIAANTFVNVSSSPGDGGGVAANVNRWRRQLGLPESSEVEKTVRPLGAGVMVELSGGPTALVGVIVPQAGRTWFYKLMGEPSVVQAQKEAFVRFVQGVEY